MSNMISFSGIKAAVLITIAAGSSAAVATPPATANAPAVKPETIAPNAGASSSGGAFFVAPTELSKAQQDGQTKALSSTEVPEPGMIGLFGAGLIGLAYARMRRRKIED